MREGASLYIFAIIGYQKSARIVELGMQWVISQIWVKLLSAVKTTDVNSDCAPPSLP